MADLGALQAVALAKRDEILAELGLDRGEDGPAAAASLVARIGSAKKAKRDRDQRARDAQAAAAAAAGPQRRSSRCVHMRERTREVDAAARAPV